jgi:hypothetical protein
MGIVQLDVYSQYIVNPKSLLPTRPKPIEFSINDYNNTKGAPQVAWKKGLFGN